MFKVRYEFKNLFPKQYQASKDDEEKIQALKNEQYSDEYSQDGE